MLAPLEPHVNEGHYNPVVITFNTIILRNFRTIYKTLESLKTPLIQASTHTNGPRFFPQVSSLRLRHYISCHLLKNQDFILSRWNSWRFLVYLIYSYIIAISSLRNIGGTSLSVPSRARSFIFYIIYCWKPFSFGCLFEFEE